MNSRGEGRGLRPYLERVGADGRHPSPDSGFITAKLQDSKDRLFTAAEGKRQLSRWSSCFSAAKEPGTGEPCLHVTEAETVVNPELYRERLSSSNDG